MRFPATIEQTGKTTTGIRVPEQVLDELGEGKRPKVVVNIGDRYTFRTTVGQHAGAPFISVSAAVRAEACVAAGDAIEVTLEHDDAPRDVTVPSDLARALAADAAADAWFRQLTDSQRKGFVTSVTSARQPETRRRRVVRAVAALAAQQKRP